MPEREREKGEREERERREGERPDGTLRHVLVHVHQPGNAVRLPSVNATFSVSSETVNLIDFFCT